MRIILTTALLVATALTSPALATPPDSDLDGYPDSLDCAPENPDIHPRAREIPYDGIDQDCNGEDLCDVDLDGFDANAGSCTGTDCVDDNHDISPAAVDIPDDGIDQDCDGVDATLPCDFDQDGHIALACGGDDCNDADATVHPGAQEIFVDGIDQDCDGEDMCEPVPWVQGGACATGPMGSSAWMWALLLPVALRRRGGRR